MEASVSVRQVAVALSLGSVSAILHQQYEIVTSDSRAWSLVLVQHRVHEIETWIVSSDT